MDYSSVFVCLMGMGTVFFGLICLIVLTTLMGKLCAPRQSAAAPVAAAAAAPVPAAEPNRQEMIAAISAALAEELDTDITGIRILSIKKV